MGLNLQKRERFFGRTVTESIQGFPEELPIDSVGLWQIVPTGRKGFGLTGDDLVEFVRRCVAELLAHGAKPVVGGGGTKYYWIYQPQYGQTNREILDAVVKEWLLSGSPDCDPGGLWFALPSPYVGNRD